MIQGVKKGSAERARIIFTVELNFLESEIFVFCSFC